MANTIPDITLSVTDYINVYTLTGIAVGTALVIQNKSSEEVLIQIAPTKPLSTSTAGEVLPSLEQAGIDAGESGCWVKGFAKGKISVQEV